jgi:transcriptional regulator GlxA family with amidase domain
MREDANRPWTVATLASAIGMSRSALAPRFTGIIGARPIDYLANRKITFAKEALAASKMTMTGIAENAGYQLVSAFSKGLQRHWCVEAAPSCSGALLLNPGPHRLL